MQKMAVKQGADLCVGRGSFGRPGSGTEKDHCSTMEVFLPGMLFKRERLSACARNAPHMQPTLAGRHRSGWPVQLLHYKAS